MTSSPQCRFSNTACCWCHESWYSWLKSSPGRPYGSWSSSNLLSSTQAMRAKARQRGTIFRSGFPEPRRGRNPRPVGVG
eukprot:6498675-Alexandrium_andersonii.AAC.1